MTDNHEHMEPGCATAAELQIDKERYARVGRQLLQFLEDSKLDPTIAPEPYLLELPAADHELAEKCFDMARLLQIIGGPPRPANASPR